MQPLIEQIKALLLDPPTFCRAAGGVTLREYQRPVLEAVLESVVCNLGRSFVIMFPRQSGKNELQAQIETYLLIRYSQVGGEMVKVSPTWKPQSLNAMRRLERALDSNVLSRPLWSRESGYIYRIGRARLYMFSGQPEANIVGATASTLLEVDEAQDVSVAKYDRDISPMAAAFNSTRCFFGTAWTSNTLLARELRAAQAAEKQDRARRAFVITADQVGAEVPAYKTYVQEQVSRLGRTNPLIKTQFYSEEVNSEGGLFPATRKAMLQGTHAKLNAPIPGETYALAVDVAGVDEAVVSSSEISPLANPGRDATWATLARVVSAAGTKSTYEIVGRYMWVGLPHAVILQSLINLTEVWQIKNIVIDSTGVGAGIASLLDTKFPGRVVPYVFTQASKSALGWALVSAIDAGRLKDHLPGQGVDHERDLFWSQLDFVQYEILEGPSKIMRWSVPDGTRSLDGELVHDDGIISAALLTALDDVARVVGGDPLVIYAPDPIMEIDSNF